jgi:hypothetical protein
LTTAAPGAPAWPLQAEPTETAKPGVASPTSRSVCFRPKLSSAGVAAVDATDPPRLYSTPPSAQAGTALASAAVVGAKRSQDSSWQWPSGVVPASSTNKLAPARAASDGSRTDASTNVPARRRMIGSSDHRHSQRPKRRMYSRFTPWVSTL